MTAEGRGRERVGREGGGAACPRCCCWFPPPLSMRHGSLVLRRCAVSSPPSSAEPFVQSLNRRSKLLNKSEKLPASEAETTSTRAPRLSHYRNLSCSIQMMFLIRFGVLFLGWKRIHWGNTNLFMLAPGKLKDLCCPQRKVQSPSYPKQRLLLEEVLEPWK